MRQVFQDLAGGATSVIDVPAPQVRPQHVLVRTAASVISPGTERMLVEFGRSNVLQKARQQPDRVRDVLDKVRTDGIAPTVQAVRSKLGQPLPLGYANAGVVVEVGEGVDSFTPGQLVASNGPHAELACVAHNLCVPIPARPSGEPVAFEHASFATIGAIALESVRLAVPTLGERVVVTGLGLVGLLAVQLLRANGCEVLGLDFATERLALAERFGAETVDLSSGTDPVGVAQSWSRGRGVDAVVIAAATESNDPVHQAAAMSRTRGRIVLVGDTGLQLRRADFYDKELSFQVSCSYGPGRYDSNYEDRGQDYPVGHVRWTAGRNIEAFLDMVASDRADLEPLITHRREIGEAAAAYDSLADDRGSLGIVLTYPHVDQPAQQALKRSIRVTTPRRSSSQGCRIGVIGAGNYTRQVLLPALAGTPANLEAIASRGGADARHAADHFGFTRATTDVDSIIEDPAIDAVVITTRHDTHAELAARSLEAGKHVYVEKPLAVTLEQLDDLTTRYEALAEKPILMVGFNRRFAPLVQQMKALLDAVVGPKALVATMNAGAVPAEHWVHDPLAGGGRIIGEACHHIDLLRFLADAPIVHVSASYPDIATRDSASIQLSFEDGSIGTVHYFATGDERFPKERVEGFGGGRVLQLTNLRNLKAFGVRVRRPQPFARQDKGHRASMAAFVEAVVDDSESPIPFNEIMEVGRVSIRASGR